MSQRQLQIHWEKKGLLLDVSAHNALHSHAGVPFAHAMGGGAWRVFFASRDEHGRSHGWHVDMQLEKGELRVFPETLACVISPGELGAFDDSGAMPSWVVGLGNEVWLYYTGWSLGKTVPFYNSIGLARSHDGGRSFLRHSPAPIMGISHADPFLLNSPCVLQEARGWRMWYVSAVRWEQTAQGPRHYYLIRHAHSHDGLHWHPGREPCIGFLAPGEYAIARPCVVPVSDGYLMWYATRGSAYRIGFAASHDGTRWHRLDDQVGIAASPQGWDSQMVAFSHVFQAAGKWWMLYNGNDYGRQGFGAACAEMLPSVSQLLKAAPALHE